MTVVTKRKTSSTTSVKKDESQNAEGKVTGTQPQTKAAEPTKFRYGPMPTFPNQRVWSRCMLVLGVLVYVWYSSSKRTVETTLARQRELLPKRGQDVECDSGYLEEVRGYVGCAPTKCGRFVLDKIVTANEVDTLLNLATKGFALGGSSGGASILDLHSGALSLGEKFVNIYTLDKSSRIATPTEMAVYKMVKTKIQRTIADVFQIDVDSLHLTHPTFFSKMTNHEAKTTHDEYWHVHVDKETYESFHYTSLLYLADFDIDFQGGRFVFVGDKNSTVEPRKGRVLMFTSGAENPHYVEKVSDGVRYAITVSFTCDRSKAISDPVRH